MALFLHRKHTENIVVFRVKQYYIKLLINNAPSVQLNLALKHPVFAYEVESDACVADLFKIISPHVSGCSTSKCHSNSLLDFR